VHPFDDPEVIAGQGTIGMEILRQHATADPRRVLLCRRRRADCRRGGLHQAPAPGHKIIGVEPSMPTP
jgi:threonine dehydratase